MIRFSQNLLNLDRGSFHIRQARIEVRDDGSSRIKMSERTSRKVSAIKSVQI